MPEEKRPRIPGKVYNAAGGEIDDGQVKKGRWESPAKQRKEEMTRDNSHASIKEVMKQINQRLPERPSDAKKLSTNDVDEADEDDNELQLYSRLEFETKVRPVRDNDCLWRLHADLDEDLSTSYVNTFELVTSGEHQSFGLALRHLQHMMEKDAIDRYYILDEPHSSWAIVVCGKGTAFWAGATSHTRAALKQRQVTFNLPLAVRSSSINGDGKRATSPGNERPVTLHFKGIFQVRAMLSALFSIIRKDSQVKIICSHVFPNCTVKLNLPRVFEKFSKKTGERVFTTSFRGIFTAANESDIATAFARSNKEQNDELNATYLRERVAVTKDFDDVVKRVFPSKKQDQEENISGDSNSNDLSNPSPEEVF